MGCKFHLFVFFFFLSWLLEVKLLGRRRVDTENVLTSRIA